MSRRGRDFRKSSQCKPNRVVGERGRRRDCESREVVLLSDRAGKWIYAPHRSDITHVCMTVVAKNNNILDYNFTLYTYYSSAIYRRASQTCWVGGGGGLSSPPPPSHGHGPVRARTRVTRVRDVTSMTAASAQRERNVVRSTHVEYSARTASRRYSYDGRARGTYAARTQHNIT